MSQSNNIYISKAFAEGKVDRKLRMLEGVARILSDSYNVTVVFSPEGECKTDPEVMTLPYDKGVDEALLLGLCGHETGHLKETDFGIGRVIARHRKVHNRPLLYVIFNALEDVRIEYAMEEEYPGFKEMFKRLIPYIKEKKKPILDREQLIKDLELKGIDPVKIASIIEAEATKQRYELEYALRDAGFSEEYVEFELKKLTEAQRAPLPETQKILDVIYLILRKYDYMWYPAETITFVEDEVLDTAKRVLTCKDSQEVLDVSIEVYKILTDNEKKLRKSARKPKKEKKKKEEKKESGGMVTPPEDEDEEETIAVSKGQVLKVGSRVTHFKDSSKKGVVISIDNKAKEIEVEWE